MKLISTKTKSATTVLWIALSALALALAILALFVFRSTAPSFGEVLTLESEVREQIEISRAEILSSQYDYENALAILSHLNGEKAQSLYAKISEEKKNLQPADNYAIPHVFFHSLIADTSKAFDGDTRAAGYNQVMTTIEEFRRILSQMYERGFVLVSLHDIAEKAPDGSMKQKQIMLPPGKKPFVLSVDDVCYYEYMEGDGFASRIVIGDNGLPTCEMKNSDGSVATGEFDVVPILDAFVREHPDFSYRGAKGILALTGYNGVLGYRTCPTYAEGNPNYQKDVDDAKRVSECLKAYGWEFASHSWGHRNMGTMKIEDFRKDTNRWESEVEPIIGSCDVLIYPFGADIASWGKYTDTNERFTYLKSVGFDYFCNVDGNRAWLQLGKNYLRQGRRNLDGYRMYYDMINDKRDWLSDLFDVNEVFDKSRPLPVPPM